MDMIDDRETILSFHCLPFKFEGLPTRVSKSKESADL